MKSPTFTRIDLTEYEGTAWGFPGETGVRVKKWLALDGDPYRDTQRRWGKPDEVSINQDMSLEQMVRWLSNHGYQVFTWPGGARGFLGSPHPVRSADQIIRLRQRIERRKAGGDPALAGVEIHALDLRFVW